MDIKEDVVDELYATFNKIRENQSSGNASLNPPLFDRLLTGASQMASLASKRLSAQFICRLFSEMSQEQQKAAYTALIDLVEEDDVQTRKQVISGLPRLCCKDCPTNALKVADVLVQLLQTDDEQELSLVQHSLLQVLNSDAGEALDGIFGQINHEEVPEIARLRAIKFLADRLICVDRRQMSPRVEDAVVQQVDRALEDVSEEEFVHFVRVLASLQCMQTLGGRQRLVDMICGQADLAGEFEPRDTACVARVRGCARQALPFLSKNIITSKFVAYFLDKVLPVLSAVPDESPGSDRPRLDLLKHFAELSCHVGPTFNPTDAQLSSLLSCILTLMPLPQQLQEEESGDRAEMGKESESEVVLNFSEAECLLLALHCIGRARPAYFTERPDDLTLLRRHLQHFQIANQSYRKSLESLLQQPHHQQSQSLDASHKAALATTASVGRLIRDLFRNPPAFLGGGASSNSSDAATGAGAIAPSWRQISGGAGRSRVRVPQPPIQQQQHEDGRSGGLKRRAVDLPAYRPPAGKFSAGLGGGSVGGGGPSALPSAYGGRSRYFNVFTKRSGGR